MSKANEERAWRFLEGLVPQADVAYQQEDVEILTGMFNSVEKKERERWEGIVGSLWRDSVKRPLPTFKAEPWILWADDCCLEILRRALATEKGEPDAE